MKKRSQNKTKRLLTTALLGATALLLAGCGKTAFVVASNEAYQQAPGVFTIPPKVDILLAQDDSGSIMEVHQAMARQMPEFLTQLQAKGWDYHFTSIPLTAQRAVSQIIASQHDANWGSAWLPTYPGAVYSMDTYGTIVPQFFAKPADYTGFISYADTSNSLGGLEPGFARITSALTSGVTGTGFLRDDALLVVLVVGNGNDTSGVTKCLQNGYMVDYESLAVAPSGCRIDGVPVSNPGPTRASSLASYKAQLQVLKPVASQTKFYAAVSPVNGTCLGSGAYRGDRYLTMATQTGGESYNICSQSASGVLTSLSQSLSAQKLLLRTRYLFIDRDPDLSTVVVTKYVGGDPARAVTIPQDAANGWTFLGYRENLHAIEYPVPMNLTTGYAIELHGSAKLVGNDTASVTFKHKGWQNTAQ
ncbi:MAG: hypothetical protein NDJ90_07280 [Oligoflexia bacterium]|nr:hypothetical protein [Oligoflexia bacterium]